MADLFDACLFFVEELKPSRARFFEEALAARRADCVCLEETACSARCSSSLTQSCSAGVEGPVQRAALDVVGLVDMLDDCFALFRFSVSFSR